MWQCTFTVNIVQKHWKKKKCSENFHSNIAGKFNKWLKIMSKKPVALNMKFWCKKTKMLFSFETYSNNRFYLQTSVILVSLRHYFSC